MRPLRRWQQGCVVANNRSRYYYLPGDRGYRSAKTARHVRWFRTAEDAEEARFRRAPQNATERALNRIAKLGRWGATERFANLQQFLSFGRVRSFLDFVETKDATLDAYISRVGPDAFEREAIRYLDVSNCSLADLWFEAKENPICDTRDHF